MSDTPDGRAILASLPVWVTPSLDADLPLAVLPCLRVESLHVTREGAPFA
ncbi:MAG: hypothetical protein ACLP8Y_08245 [Thermoplasmata archaeon]